MTRRETDEKSEREGLSGREEGGRLAQCDIQSGDESQHKKLKAAARDQPANKYSN